MVPALLQGTYEAEVVSGTYYIIDDFFQYGLKFDDVCERFMFWIKGANVFASDFDKSIGEINFWLVTFYGRSLDEYLILGSIYDSSQ